jgi:hypothetical protein
MRDFRRLQNDPPTGVQGAPLDNNIMVRETDLHAHPSQQKNNFLIDLASNHFWS